MYKDENGYNWYKGNLHTHTTRSDGRKTPEEVEALYRQNGYDFLAFTDHWKYGETQEKNGCLLLSGAEYDFGKNIREGILHIVGIGMLQDPGVERTDSPQECIDKIRAAGGIAHLAHPAWSLNTTAQIASLEGLYATEIFNSVSDLPRNCRPYSGAILDLLALEGRFLPLIATDDAHFYNTADTCRSYIMVKAEECTREALLSAILRGDFYATQGPRLSVTCTGRTLSVETSAVDSIVCFTDTVWEGHRAEVGKDLTEAVFELSDKVGWARIEATDAEGNTAWSSYFVFS